MGAETGLKGPEKQCSTTHRIPRSTKEEMGSITLIALLAFVAQAHAEELAANDMTDAQNAMDEFTDELLDTLADKLADQLIIVEEQPEDDDALEDDDVLDYVLGLSGGAKPMKAMAAMASPMKAMATMMATNEGNGSYEGYEGHEG